MQIPIRKPGKYTHLKADPNITAEKYRALEEKLRRMLASRPRLIEEVKKHAADGDFSENAAYQIAKGRLRGLNNRIDETENLLRRAVIIRPGSTASIRLGHKVTIEAGGKTKAYRILGSAETDPAKGVISHNSPIGKALLGRRAGETVKVRLAGNEASYKIIKIED